MKKILIACLMVLVGSGAVFADLENLGISDSTRATISAGYNWVETEDNAARAAEYMYQDVSGTASFDVRGGKNTHYILEGDYKNEYDYAFSAHIDRNNATRLDLRLEKIFHNLDHLIYDPAHPEGRQDATTNTTGPAFQIRYDDYNPGAEYFLKGTTAEAKIRTKIPDMPSHLSVGYWRYEKEGEEQFRFTDEGCSTQCHFQSRTREFDRTIHEVNGEYDAHLGKIDVIFKHKYRELVIDDDVPTDTFNDHNRLRPGAGTYEHDADPESQMHESSIEMHSSLAGGLNLAGSGTYGVRKNNNNSRVTGVDPIVAEIDYFKMALDLTHTTSKKFSYNVKSRFLDLNNNNTNPDLIDPFVFDGTGAVNPTPTPVAVRPNIDITRSKNEINATLRPNNTLTLKGTVSVEQIKRSNTGVAMPFHSSDLPGDPTAIDPVWELPDEEIITRAKLSFFARPFKNRSTKVNGWYQYQNNNDPAYGASFADSHQVFLSTTYAEKMNWGFNGSLRALLETNDEIDRVVIEESVTPETLVSNILKRDKEQQSVNLGFWYNPVQNLLATLNYGYARTHITQDLTFGSVPAAAPADPFDITAGSFIITDRDVDYLQEVHTVNLGASSRFLGNFKAKLDAYYTRSLAFYSPDFDIPSGVFNYSFGTGTGPANSDDLKEISQYDMDQYGVKFGLDYYVTPNFEISAQYTYDDYDEKYTDAFDGSVQTATANLAYRF